MKITYVAHTRFPTEKAHGHQIAQVCSAMGKLGHNVTLIHPTVWTAVKENPYSYYAVDKSFEILPVKIFDALSAWWIPGSLAFAVSMWSYRRALREFLKHHKADLLYCRSWEVLKPLIGTGTRTILELHTLPKRGLKKFVDQCNRCWKVVSLTSPMKEEVVKWGVDAKRIVVEPDGVDYSRFEHPPSGSNAKNRWNLPQDCWIIGYCGSLVARNTLEKGVKEFLDALLILRRGEAKCFGWIVGGPALWVKKYQKYANGLGLRDTDVRFEGSVSAVDVPSAISAFDVCIYPVPSSAHPYFTRDTSPLKLFEYLASAKPVVCADVPPVRDVVSEDHVIFSRPGDSCSLAEAVSDILLHEDAAHARARAGKDLVKKYDWSERMKRVLQGMY